jgi:2-polyprenyl-3-methyl-5-hydroxy-6-metoxy-1,4-benzoquinol methylase
MENNRFRNQDDWYYNLVKPWIALIETGDNSILDIGCGAGSFGRALKAQGRGKKVIGIEIFQEAAREATKYYDKVYIGDAETVEIHEENQFDYVVCNDVIEHLKDPWQMIKKIHGWLRKNGKLLISVPNIRYCEVLYQIIAKGNFTYVDAGIMDITHLRFFTINSVREMLNDGGFNVKYCQMEIPGKKRKMLNFVTFKAFEEFLGKQIVILAECIKA